MFNSLWQDWTTERPLREARSEHAPRRGTKSQRGTSRLCQQRAEALCLNGFPPNSQLGRGFLAASATPQRMPAKAQHQMGVHGAPNKEPFLDGQVKGFGLLVLGTPERSRVSAVLVSSSPFDHVPSMDPMLARVRNVCVCVWVREIEPFQLEISKDP